jgi:hypothetical protein
MATRELFFARFALPLVPFGCLLAAYGVTRLAALGQDGRARRGLAIAGCLLAIGPPLALSARLVGLGRATDTRVLAERWLAGNVPPGTKVAAQSYSLPNWPPAAGPSGAYELSVFTPLSAAGQFDRLACDGNRYLLTSSFRADRQRTVGRPGAPTGYERLAAQAQLVASFSPVDGERQAPPFNPDDIGLPYWTVTRYDRPGPTINAYRLPPAACPPGSESDGSAEAPPFQPWPTSGS